MAKTKRIPLKQSEIKREVKTIIKELKVIHKRLNSLLIDAETLEDSLTDDERSLGKYYPLEELAVNLIYARDEIKEVCIDLENKR